MRCPHCGEPVAAGQERCFACGQPVRRGGGLRREGLLDYRILLIAGLALLVGVSGALVALFARPKSSPKKKDVRPKTRAVLTTQDSSSWAARLRRDSLPVSVDAGRIQRAQRQLDKLQGRYEQLKQQVLGESPTPEQQQLMREIDVELSRLRGMVTGFTGLLTREQRDRLEEEIADGQRRLANLISKFARAPKKR
ncbi:MAG: hypothetical protein ABIK44_03030 [candidate division WOR-3 bacterium]